MKRSEDVRLIVVLGLIGLVAWALARSVREQRRDWLRRLALPGVWSGEQDGCRYRLVLSGDLAGGTYRETSQSAAGPVEERGRWSLDGQLLRFAPEGRPSSACDLRLFDTGRIGLHGPGRARRVYEREGDAPAGLPQRR